MNQDDIKTAIHQALDERDSIDQETHHAHHAFVGDCIARRVRREANFDKVRATVLGGIVLGCLGALVTSLMWLGRLVWASLHGLK